MIFFIFCLNRASMVLQETESNNNGTAPYSSWRNYDDLNEYFWYLTHRSVFSSSLYSLSTNWSKVHFYDCIHCTCHTVGKRGIVPDSAASHVQSYLIVKVDFSEVCMIQLSSMADSWVLIFLLMPLVLSLVLFRSWHLCCRCLQFMSRCWSYLVDVHTCDISCTCMQELKMFHTAAMAIG